FVLLVLPGGLAQVTAGLRKRVFVLVARLRRIELPGAAGGDPVPEAEPVETDPELVVVCTCSSSVTTWTSPTAGRRSSSTCRSTSTRARLWPCSARTAPGSRRCCGPSPA